MQVLTRNPEARRLSIGLRTPRYNFSRRPCNCLSYLFDCKPRLMKIFYHLMMFTIKGGLHFLLH